MGASAVRQAVVTVQGIAGTFGALTGGEKSAEVNKAYNGGSTRADVVSGIPEVADITVSRPFDPERDADLAASLLAVVGDWRTTVTKTFTNGNMSRARAKPRVYSDALLTGVSEPEVDASSSDVGMLELTFAVAEVS